MKQKVANIVFNPFINDSRVLKESVSLGKNDYEVEVIAHLSKGLPNKEQKEYFKIRRFGYLDRTKANGTLAKLKAYLKFAHKTIHYTKHFDYLHCNDLNTLPIGFIVKRFYNKNVKIVYDAHEYETETIGLSGFKKKMAQFLERKLIKKADAVIVVSNAIAQAYQGLYNIEKPFLILNTPNYQHVKKQNLLRENLNIDKNKKLFLYQGGLSTGRGIEIILETFKNIQGSDNVVVFMGYGELQEEVQKHAQKYDNIYWHKAVSPEVLLNYTSSADYGISLIEDACLSYRYCLPNKMFEYAMAGLPVIVSNLPEMKVITEQYGIGLVMEENTQKGLENAIFKIQTLDPEVLNKNVEKAQHVFNWQEQEKELLRLYSNLT